MAAAGRRSAAGPSGTATGARRRAWPGHARPGPVTPPVQAPAACRAAGTRSPHRDYLAHLDRAELRVRAAAGDRHGRVPVRRLDHEVTGDDLLALGERPVQDPPLAVPGADTHGLRDRMQRRPSLERALAQQATR